jgi:hypothetical protein
MSTKTLRKRIAVVAVASMGFGLLSVAAANATTVDSGEVSTSSAVATTPGLCNKVTTAGSQSVVVVAGSSFVLTYTDGASDTDDIYVAVSGNATISAATSGWEAVTLSDATNTSAAATGQTLTIKAGSVGTAKISISTSATTSVVEAISVTIVSACAGSTMSPTYSFLAAIDSTEAQDNTAEASNADTTDATLVAADGHGYIGIKLANAYNGTLDSAAMVATVTSGNANVTIAEEANGSLPATGKAKTSVLASTGAKVVVKVTPAVAGVPTTATVQVTYDGTVIGSRTFTFEGYAASIAISDVVVGKVGADSAGNGVYFRYQVKDSAGNNLRSRSISNDSTANAPSSVTDISSGFVDGDTDATGSDGSKSADITSTTMGNGTAANIICTANGRTSVGVKYVDPLDVTTTIRASVPVICADPLDTWTVAMDKAVYAPGEIATLTVTGKDADGIPAPSLVAMSGVEYSFGGMTAVTAPTNGDLFTSGAGVKTYKFAVGTSEGSFVGTFKITGATDTAAKTVQYKVAAATGAVTNADVLKAIVSLIASINKQIAALQKALLRR